MPNANGNASPYPLPGGSNKLGTLPLLFTISSNMPGDVALDIGTISKQTGPINVPYLSPQALTALAAGQISAVLYGTTTPAVLTAPPAVGAGVASPGGYASKMDFINLQAYITGNVTIGMRQ
jgi:hypothetical protein